MTIDINNLTDEQKRQLIIALQASLKTSPRAEDKLINEIRETRFNAGFKCPHCGSSHVVRHGTYKGNKQRYLCRNCKTTFSDLTNTPMSRTKFPEKWGLFADCMLKGYSLRKSAEIIGVSYVSLFYWRHKLLEALKKTENRPFDGIVEMDETFFLHSEKGKRNITYRKPRKRGGVAKKKGIKAPHVCVIVAKDRSKNTISQVVNIGGAKVDKISKVVSPYLNNMNILCTDGWKGYITLADSKDMDHHVLQENRVYRGIFHIQNVNAYHSRLKKWIDRFNGVASKYLDNYLAWFKFLDSKRFEDTTGILVESCLHNTQDTNDSIRLRGFKIA
jgi:transposase-like protein